MKYNDYAISEKFTVNLNPLNVTADSIDKKHDWVNVDFNSGIKPYGNVLITLRINPKDSMDFDIHYQIRKVPLALFNPYLVTYTSFPLDRGTLEIIGTWNVRNGMINSNNHLLIIDPRRTGRVRNKDKKWLPLPLIMSLVRERGNVIDYEIPITGDLKNPKFHFHDVLMDMLENIFVKPATASYRLEVKNIEAEIEEFFTLKWEMRTSVLQRNQEKFIDKLAGFLRKNPNVSITVYPIAYADKEKEYILFFEAKKKYYLMINHKNARSFSTGDSERVDKMSVKDAMFVHYLNKLSADTMLHKIQDKCGNYIGSVLVSARFEQLSKERERAFMFQFRENDVEGQVKILKAENKTPYNGFSFFKITYNGPPPANVIKAHLKMNELNNKGPRKKYNGKRKKYQP
ncbi:MAG: DUF748 domain-containing protein [Bacteroidetes bacterium]|nr:DUF748 domain-containing protein [Bacteroidota bacterium]